MNSIDDLFKKPTLPSKRKLEINHDANEAYKATKLSAHANVKTNGHTTVEDEPDQDDIEAGPGLPPEDEEPTNEEDGRFFGGGVTKNTNEVLDYIDEREQDDEAPEKIDAAWVRKMAVNFEKRINKNTELRAKFEDTPQKFMSSEADLDADIKALSILSEHPELYGEFVKLGCVASLVSLLSHDNTDIAIDAIEIINELTDEDVDAEQGQWDELVDAMLEADLLNLLYENISRLNEELESDRAGIYHILSVMENMSSRSTIVTSLGMETKFLEWLLSRIQTKETSVSQNKQYAAENLAILLQSSPDNRAKFIGMNGMDACLQLLSPYRKKNPAKGTDEEEFVENMFDCLTCCVDDTAGKTNFLDAEGVELCLIMLREGKISRRRALRLLDHALAGAAGELCCERLVEAAGLKTIFNLFMKGQESESTEHLLGIFASLLRLLPVDNAPRIRLLAKFEEKNWRVIDNLVQKRREAASGVAIVDKEIENETADVSSEEKQERADERLSRRLDAGLTALQTADTVLAWLAAENGNARHMINETLADRGEDLTEIRKTLQDQLDLMKASPDVEDSVAKDMIETLLNCL